MEHKKLHFAKLLISYQCEWKMSPKRGSKKKKKKKKKKKEKKGKQKSQHKYMEYI